MESLVKKYYALGLYTVDDLKVFVKAAYITADDFKTLSGTDYTALTSESTSTAASDSTAATSGTANVTPTV